MLRFVMQISRLDGNTGLKTKGIKTIDIDVPILQSLLTQGGLSESSYEVTDLYGIEILTDTSVAAPENGSESALHTTAPAVKPEAGQPA
jgi:hypothetical protein